MRGYFGIGIERASKPMNAGNLFRTAHGFGASFLFTVADALGTLSPSSDTSRSFGKLPYYAYSSVEEMALPENCKLVGVELLDDAVMLPTFHHPVSAAYVLGPEKGSLSAEMLERCDHVVKIPTSFCLNVATAGAIIMYDRVLTLGRFAARPISELGRPVPVPAHRHGPDRRR